MNDPALVRRFERLGDLLRDGQGFAEWNWSARNLLGQVIALDEFHYERGGAAALFEPVDRGDVRVIQRGENFGFALKAREPVSIGGQRRRQNLDRNLAFQLGIGGPIHLAHPALSDMGDDFIGAKPCTWSQSQRPEV